MVYTTTEIAVFMAYFFSVNWGLLKEGQKRWDKSVLTSEMDRERMDRAGRLGCVVYRGCKSCIAIAGEGEGR